MKAEQKNINFQKALDFLTKNSENFHILYVEDNEDVRTYIEVMLRKIFKEVIVCSNGMQGYEKYREYKKHNKCFDLVITDINMPKMNGFEMCTEIKKFNKSIPIVITSAHNDPNFLKEAIDIGVNAYAMKPIDLYQLIDNMIMAVEPFYLKKKLEEMNVSLQQKVEDGIKQIKSILDAQDNLVMLINGTKIQNVNKKLLDFFQFDTYEELKDSDFTIIDYFEVEEGFFNKNLITNNNDELWFSYMLNHLNDINKIVKMKNKNNEYRIFAVNIDNIENQNRSFVISFTDITEIKEESTLLEYQATHDTLTGLYNRQKFNDIFDKELKRDKRYKNNLSLIIFDIDYFKKINDDFGHQVGDEVLKDISTLVKNGIREQDTLVRWGGEEFIILLPQTDLEGATNKANNLKDIIWAYENKNISRRVTASFGVTVLQEDDSQDSIITRADNALYEAKETGRNKTVSI